ncbi:hypothetical protein [Candidatus Competibacter phosphatis]|nr:hypothetical protein [Candidatus Competibacter phosphatis]
MMKNMRKMTGSVVLAATLLAGGLALAADAKKAVRDRLDRRNTIRLHSGR